MKAPQCVLLLMGLLFSSSVLARPVAIPELPELAAQADLVAIIQPISTTNASDRLTSAGPKYGPRNPEDYQGLNTQFKVLLVLKASAALSAVREPLTNTITLLHFFHSAGPIEFNGGLFAYFNFPPTTLQTTASHRPNRKIAESPPTYLAFLKWNKDGRFRPVTGDYDSAPSFRIVTTPHPDVGMYQADDVIEAGIAANYSGDAGIEKDPAVVFTENFEGKDFARWDSAPHPQPPSVQLATEPAWVHSGKQSAQFLVPSGKGVGAGLVKWFKPGYDRLYARWYCRFAEDYDQGNLNHTGAKLAAETDRWNLGVAGQKPTGTDFFITGLEPWRDWKRNPPPGELMFYTYYPDMKRDPDGNWWGNSFKPEQKCLLERGRWYCLEMMVKANTPGNANGEQAFWVNGELKDRFQGIRWRDSDALKLNCFWLTIYIHESPQTNRLWMDDVVVATKYIGPRR